jgi:hypothetical protein
MTDRDLMQQALDALEELNETNSYWWQEVDEATLAQMEAAIVALNERLAHCDRCGKRLGGEGDIHTCTPDPIGDAQDRLIAEMAAQPEQEPDAFALRTKKHGLEFNSGYGMVKTLEQAQEMQRRHMGNLEIVELRATPPAAAQQEPVALREALAEALGCVYVCNRTWSAWGIGTMSQDDFYPAAESDDVLDSLVEAVAKARPVKDEWELRGELARLKCWHRLTEDEVNDLLRFAANTPPAAQRTWVGLTPEEIDKTHETQVWDARRSFARAIEAKLKEKNNG